VVPSPRPRRILELDVIELLVAAGIVVICAGGGGIPVVRDENGYLTGVEAVIDKDLAGALLARELGADFFLMLTDVDAVYLDWGTPGARPARSASPEALRKMAFAEGSMAPKVEAACEFAERTGGRAGIGRLNEAGNILKGTAGTLISSDYPGIHCRH
jgi:carbamate kinase